MIERIGKRDILVSILLTIMTFGLYGLIWYVEITEDAKRASGDRSINGSKTLLFLIITCGIYFFYWSFKVGKMIYEAKVKRNLQTSNKSLLYFILNFVFLGLVNIILMQKELNDISEFDYNGQI